MLQDGHAIWGGGLSSTAAETPNPKVGKAASGDLALPSDAKGGAISISSSLSPGGDARQRWLRLCEQVWRS
eukprot:5951613-Pleurochrysis_carterae.AAC.2